MCFSCIKSCNLYKIFIIHFSLIRTKRRCLSFNLSDHQIFNSIFQKLLYKELYRLHTLTVTLQYKKKQTWEKHKPSNIKYLNQCYNPSVWMALNCSRNPTQGGDGGATIHLWSLHCVLLGLSKVKKKKKIFFKILFSGASPADHHLSGLTPKCWNFSEGSMH